MTIGSDGHSDLVVDSETVSARHCEIVVDGRGYVLRDLGSRTGTWIGEVRVTEAVLPSRAWIQIGDCLLSFAVVVDKEEHGQGFSRLVGESPAMKQAIERLERIASREVTMLIEGESGTGKELAAEAVHAASGRSGGPFVVVDCSALARNLIEAELFGHERGAYTGATQAREGAFVRAHGGTVFLDEVGELDLELQPRLLRMIERREVKPLGSPTSRRVDVRIIAATNRHLRDDVARGSFRADLYYRLAVAMVRLPPLRDRPEDVPLLCRHFLDDLSERDGVRYSLTDEQIVRLAKRPWPGNVRELRNVVERLATFGVEALETPRPERLTSVTAALQRQGFHAAKAELVATFKLGYLKAILDEHQGNITAAASAAGVDRVHFLRLMDRHGLRKRA